MKKKFLTIFLTITIFWNKSFAQTASSTNKNSNNQNQLLPKKNTPQKLSPEEEKLKELERQLKNEMQDSDIRIKNLSPADKTRFHNSNNEFNKKIDRAFQDFKIETEKNFKITNINLITNHIFNKNNNSRQSSQMPPQIKKIYDSNVSQYEKLDKEKKKALKKAMIKLRRNIAKIQIQRKEEINKILGKDYKLIHQFEKEEDIAIDEKTIQ